jgi:hypothetical protein
LVFDEQPFTVRIAKPAITTDSTDEPPTSEEKEEEEEEVQTRPRSAR